jgi:hypothetical protein
VNQFHYRRPALRVGDGRHVSFGLIEHEVNVALGTVEEFSINADVVVLGIGFAAQLADDLPIHRHATLLDHLFGVAAGCDSGCGYDFLQALGSHAGITANWVV